MTGIQSQLAEEMIADLLRHIRHNDEIIARQSNLIANFDILGKDTRLAHDILNRLIHSQERMLRQLARMQGTIPTA
jgi:hypothetical protein